MATDEHTTDRHDESDSAQFGDDPHHLAATPFEEGHCTDCGTYVVRAKGYKGDSRCLECARTHHRMTWASGEPIGTWHPTVGYHHTTPQTQKPPDTKTEWQWACINCLTVGPAHNAQHALQQEAAHQQQCLGKNAGEY